jgi:hypothetical protein
VQRQSRSGRKDHALFYFTLLMLGLLYLFFRESRLGLAMRVLFVPNIAERVSTGLAGAIYGVILLLVIYVMPSGAAGFVRFAAARLKLRGKPR